MENQPKTDSKILKVRQILESIDFIISFNQKSIKETIDNVNQFRRNIYYGELIKRLTHIRDMIQNHVSYLDKKVHKLENNHRYITKEEFSELNNTLNKMEDEEILFNSEMLIDFTKSHIDFVIKWLTDNILFNINPSSTSKLSNISQEIVNEAQLEVIKTLQNFRQTF